MQSKAPTVGQYLAGLPADRREAIQALRTVILRNLDEGFEEGMQYGMIGYYVPHRIYPAGYHCDPRQPLPFAALSSQKNHMGFGLMTLYADPVEEKRFRAAWVKTGRRLDMGKSCVRFRRIEDVPLDVVADAFRRVKASDYIALYERAIRDRNAHRASASPAKKAPVAPRRAASTRAASKRSAAKHASTASAKPTARPSARTGRRRTRTAR